MAFPTESEGRDAFVTELKDQMKYWRKFKAVGQIENIEVKYYDFDPISHFMVADNRLLYFRLFNPTHESTGVRTRHLFAFNAHLYAEQILGSLP